MWKCMNCGKENQSNRDHCWKCGTKEDGTPPENPENFSLPYGGSSTSSLIMEPAAKGAKKGNAPSSESEAAAAVSRNLEVSSLMSRYWDAYIVARATTGLGEIIKVVAVVLATLIVLVSLLIGGKVGGGAGLIAFLLGLVGAAFAGGQIYLLGLIVMAQGQILKASLDSAVNSSPFLQNEHRAKIMSLR